MPQIYLVVQGKAPFEHSNHIVKVDVETTCLHFKPWCILKKQSKRQDHLELCHRNPDILERVLNQIAISNSTEWGVHTHASYKTTRTWEKFNHWGKNMILLSDQLWSIANNSNSFANRGKSIIRNDLGLYKLSDIYLI